MPSDLLTPAQIAEIAERASLVTVDGKRPPGVYGSVHDLLRHAAAQAARIEELEEAIHWAVGLRGDFRPRGEGEGPYWWRRELMTRASLSHTPATPEAP